MKTIEEISAAMTAVIDGAAGRSLTADEVTAYEGLETELQAVQVSDQIRQRDRAYNVVRTPAGVPKVGTTEEDTLGKAFENYLRTGRPNADISGLQVTNAQGTTSDPAGGYMVPPEFRQKLVEVQKAYGGIGPEADGFTTTSGATLEYPTLDDTANSGQITAEGAAVAGGADLVFGTVALGAFKYTSSGASNAPLKVNVELLQDAAFDVQGLVSRKLGERIARKQAVDWVTGAGTTLPFGIARAGLTADVTVTAGTITYAQLLSIETALDPAYEQNAKWGMNKASWQIVRGLVGTDGRPLVQESAQAGIGGRPVRMLLGYPVVIDQAFPSLATATVKWGLLGDIKEAYAIRRVSNVVVIVNPYSSAASGQVEFTAWERADGAVQNRKAYSLAATT